MADQFSSTTLSGRYNDDFDVTDHYHQILFNSGRALQARELTQMQTLIYQELGRFGRNIFKEGAAVSNGGSAINAEYDYIQISSSSGQFADIPVGTELTNGLIRARVLDVKPNDGDKYPINTLYINYIDGNVATVGATPPVFSGGETLTGGGYTLTIATVASASSTSPATSPVGKGTRIDVAEGDFFVVGRFVNTSAQSIVLSAYTQTPTTDVGFKVIQQVVTVNDDPDLYDNTPTNVNTSSPGADRYKINLQLTEKSLVTSDDTFVFVCRVENGKIVDEIDTNEGYNKINDLLALRTREESGDYIVNPFTIDFDSADAENLSLTISAGLAYVDGYRAEVSSPVELIVPRSIGDGELVNNDTVPINYGNYVYVLNTSNELGVLDLSYPLFDLNNSSAVKIGEARVRGIEPSGSRYKLYLFDIAMNAGQEFSNVKTIGSAPNLYNVDNSTNTDAVLYGTLDNDLLMPTPRPRPASFADMIVTSQRSIQLSSDATSAPNSRIAMPSLAGDPNLTYVDGGLWIIQTASGTGFFVPGDVQITAGGDEASIGDASIAPSTSYDIIYYRKNSNATARTKTLTQYTEAFSVVNGVASMKVPDVQEIISINLRNTDGTNGNNCADRFILDDGQRDNYYAHSRLLLKEGQTSPGSINVTYTRFDRGGSGDFYAPSSYTNVPYADIPTHVLADGTEVSLRNYIDFRPDKDSDGVGIGTAVFNNIHYLPRTGSSIDADITYHLPRADKLIIDQNGQLSILMGQQSRDPQLKKTPENALELYQILMNANTANEEDVQIRAIEHKHYTMADIAKIDNKLEDLKQYTEMNIAELRAYHTPALDSDGNERPESGIQIDDFQDQTGSDTGDEDYSASLDPENNLIRPKADEDNIRLIRDVTYENAIGNVNIVRKGDNVYLNYDSAEWKYQDLASTHININPFGLVDNVGVIKLSPSTDEWKDSKADAIKALQGSSKLDNKQAFLWNNWQWNWKGRNSEDLWVGNPERGNYRGVRTRNEIYEDDGYSSGRSVNRNAFGYVRRVVQRDTLRKKIGNQYIDLALVPWIRSRKIYFKAQGLKPNTKFTPFFDGKNVSDWCKQEPFVQWADRTDDIGNKYTYNTLLGHPENSTELVSDGNGKIEGSFWIPNLKPEYFVAKKYKGRKIKNTYLRFRAGIREFKLLDINENDWARANSKAFTYYTVGGALWHKFGGILTTRGFMHNWPLGFGYAGVPTFGPTELKNVLDYTTNGGSTVTGINLAQLSGQYSPLTSSLSNTALQTLSSNGEMSQVLSDYITVNNKQFASGVAAPVSLPQNPLAQTFFVDNDFGVTLTKVTLFFRSKDAETPVSIHLRPVVNGRPSNTDIVPDSHVFLNPSQVTAIGTEPTLGEISTRGTDFVFEEPVYLQPRMHYAVVITSQSTKYEVFSARTQQTVLGSATRTVSTQPAPGSLFLPQNGVFWSESKGQDLMMRLARASFSLSGGTLMLRNAPLPSRLLDANPIRMTSGSANVFVNAPCHGHAVGDTVRLDSALDISNITAATLNTSHTITAVDIHGYQFVLQGQTCDSDITGGGDRVLTTRNVVFDVANPTIETILPNQTSVDMGAKFVTGIHVSQDTSKRFRPNDTGVNMLAANFERITPNTNIEFDQPRAIYHPGIEDVSSGVGGVTPGKNASVYVKVDLKTTSNYVSPIIDLQRCSLDLAGECIDDPLVSPHIYPVDETQPSGGTTGSKHITTPVTLEIPSCGFDVRYEGSIPTDGQIDTYYRVCTSGENLAEKNWILQPNENSVAPSAPGSFNQVQVLPGGPNGTLPHFDQAQLKFVMRGLGKGPSIKNLSIKYLAV